MRRYARGIDPGDGPALARLVHSAVTETVPDRTLQSEDVTAIVSTVAAHPEVREAMVEAQRRVADGRPVVMAGRDIGTVVLPHAPVKIYLTASVDARVERRRAQLEKAGTEIDAQRLRDEIEARDRSDSTRAVSPLEPAHDAHRIDSSALAVTGVVDAILEIVRRTAGVAMNPRIYDIASGLLRVIFVTVFRARAYGVENIPREGALIMACNHLSYLDPPALCFSPRRISFMAKKELFEIPVLGPLITRRRSLSGRSSGQREIGHQTLARRVAGGRHRGYLSRGDAQPRGRCAAPNRGRAARGPFRRPRSPGLRARRQPGAPMGQ